MSAKLSHAEKIALLAWLLEKEALTVDELHAKTHIPDSTIRYLLRGMRRGAEPGKPRIYIEHWSIPESWYIPHYRFGTGVDQATRPKRTRTEAAALYRKRLSEDPERLAHYRKVKAACEKRRREKINAAARRRRAVKKEELQRQARASIQPRMDPWASLFFGGAAKIGLEGATA